MNPQYDIYPNEGSHFQPDVPELTKKANEDELAASARFLPVLNDVIAWFNLAIESTDSRKAVHDEAKARGKSYEVIDEAYDIVRTVLEAKKEEFRNLKLNIPE